VFGVLGGVELRGVAQQRVDLTDQPVPVTVGIGRRVRRDLRAIDRDGAEPGHARGRGDL
jgi:hypothetical protein